MGRWFRFEPDFLIPVYFQYEVRNMVTNIEEFLFDCIFSGRCSMGVLYIPKAFRQNAFA